MPSTHTILNASKFFVVQRLKFCIHQNNLLETLDGSLIKISRGIDSIQLILIFKKILQQEACI